MKRTLTARLVATAAASLLALGLAACDMEGVDEGELEQPELNG